MPASKTRVEFFIRKLKWLDAVGIAMGKDHLTAHVAFTIAYHLNSDTGETFVGRETISDLIGIHVRSVELSIKKLETLGFLHVRRSRGRGRVNTYTLGFPEKAVPEAQKGGETTPKRRSPNRPNLIESNLGELTLGNSGIEGTAVAASRAPLPSVCSARPTPALSLMSKPVQPRRFVNRGEYEQRLAELITKAGGDGWGVLMALDEVRVAALCRRLKNGVLTQMEINELCAPRRAVVGSG